MKELIEGFKLLGAMVIMFMYGCAIGLPFYNPWFFVYSIIMIVMIPTIEKLSHRWL